MKRAPVKKKRPRVASSGYRRLRKSGRGSALQSFGPDVTLGLDMPNAAFEPITLSALVNDDGATLVKRSFTGRWLIPDGQRLYIGGDSLNFGWAVAFTKWGSFVVHQEGHPRPFTEYDSFDKMIVELPPTVQRFVVASMKADPCIIEMDPLRGGVGAESLTPAS